MIVLLILLAILIGGLHGFIQGMIMVQPSDGAFKGKEHGVRGHIAFRWYHAMYALLMASIGVLAILLWERSQSMAVLRFVPLYCGLVCSGWAMSEVCYQIARWGRLIQYEHVVILDFYSFYVVGDAHNRWVAGRVVFAIILLMLGD